MEERVDILLTTYNTNPIFLRKQIDSILNQTYKNFKLIISDDCSNNEAVRETLDFYAKQDNRIEVYYQEKNIGCTKGFEFLLNKSTAEFVAFADHDDIWYSNKIEECVKTLKQEDVSLVYCDANQIDENDSVIHESYLRYKNMPVLNGTYKKILPFSRHIAIGCSQLFTKEVKELMLPFTEKVYAHDWHSTYIASNLKGIFCIDKPLFGYRIHEGNIFGGRSFKQNIKLWKEKEGSSFKSYIKYRNRAITDIYLAGVLMCKDYSEKVYEKKRQKNNNDNDVNLDTIKDNQLDKIKLEDKVIKYFEKAQKTRFYNLKIHNYFKYLSFKGIGKRKYKEIMLLHFPLLSFIVFKMS